METETKKNFDCWTCEWEGEVSGSCHIQCNHPSLKQVNANPGFSLMGILASVGRVPGFMFNNKELNIKANPHGIKNGWFNFPFNFDPIWLENCDGYKKEQPK